MNEYWYLIVIADCDGSIPIDGYGLQFVDYVGLPVDK